MAGCGQASEQGGVLEGEPIHVPVEVRALGGQYGRGTMAGRVCDVALGGWRFEPIDPHTVRGCTGGSVWKGHNGWKSV